jgi:hypothetical protein
MSGFGGASSGGSLFPSDDGLAKIADLFVSKAGRELSAEGIQMLLFLQMNGSADLAAGVLEAKGYMASASDMTRVIEKLSPAQTMRDQMEFASKLQSDRMK